MLQERGEFSAHTADYWQAANFGLALSKVNSIQSYFSNQALKIQSALYTITGAETPMQQYISTATVYIEWFSEIIQITKKIFVCLQELWTGEKLTQLLAVAGLPNYDWYFSSS